MISPLLLKAYHRALKFGIMAPSWNKATIVVRVMMPVSGAEPTLSIHGLHPPVPVTAGATITATGIMCLPATLSIPQTAGALISATGIMCTLAQLGNYMHFAEGANPESDFTSCILSWPCNVGKYYSGFSTEMFSVAGEDSRYRRTGRGEEAVAIIGRGGQSWSQSSDGGTDGRTLARSSPSPAIAIVGLGGDSGNHRTVTVCVCVCRTDGRLLVTLTRYKAANIEN